MLAPFAWMLLSSFKTPGEIMAVPLKWFPAQVNGENYQRAWETLELGRLLWNSVLVTGGAVLGVLAISSLTGYALAKLPFPGRSVVFYVILSLMMVPFFMLMIPLFVIVKNLGLVDTYWGVLLPEIAPAFGMFVMRQFMMGVPDELLDAARIDGAGEWTIFWRVALPLVKPGLVALAIFSLTYHWDNFLWPMLVLTSPEKWTLPVGLNQLWDPVKIETYGMFMAGTTVSVLPMIVAFLVAQRQFVEGVARIGIKG